MISAEFKEALRDFGLEWFGRYYSTYRGFVIDNEDPECLGRLKVAVPQVYGKNNYNYWAWPVGMFAGKDIGFYAIPNVGDMIWVRFEVGDMDFPIWEYGHWNRNFTVPGKVKSYKQKVFQTTSGMRMMFDDDKKVIQLWKKDKRVVEINDDGISLGSEGKSQYHAVLGEINEEVLEELRSDINDISSWMKDYCTEQSVAAGSVGILAPLIPAYSKLLGLLVKLLVTLEALKKKIPTTKSDVVTLDK